MRLHSPDRPASISCLSAEMTNAKRPHTMNRLNPDHCSQQTQHPPPPPFSKPEKKMDLAVSGPGKAAT
ncbi:MAG: hypothetical protein Q8P67_29180 [archaeon]|nr:hypothetical protein [archaeon]